MTSSSSNEKCPYCGKALEFQKELGYRCSRIVHLVQHSVCAALKIPPEAIPDQPYWDAAEACEKDTWEEAAYMSHDLILDAINSFGGLLGEKEEERAERKALAWLKSHYPSV